MDLAGGLGSTRACPCDETELEIIELCKIFAYSRWDRCAVPV